MRLYYTLNKWAGIEVDIKGILKSGRYDRQIKAARKLAKEMYERAKHRS